MLLTPHILVGAAIGTVFSSWPPVVVCAFLSHFLLDAIPHTEGCTFTSEKDDSPTKTDWIVAGIDITFVIVILSYLLWNRTDYFLPIVGGIFASITDFIDNVPLWNIYTRKLPVFRQIHQIHQYVHYELSPKYWPIGVLTQLIITILMIGILFLS